MAISRANTEVSLHWFERAEDIIKEMNLDEIKDATLKSLIAELRGKFRIWKKK